MIRLGMTLGIKEEKIEEYKKEQNEKAKQIPLGYLGKPFELSKIVFSVLNTTNSFNGINIRVNGGKF